MDSYICSLSALSCALLKSIKSRWIEILNSFIFFRICCNTKSDLSSIFFGETPPGNVQVCLYMRKEFCIQDIRKCLLCYIQQGDVSIVSISQLVTFLLLWTYNSFKSLFCYFFTNPYWWNICFSHCFSLLPPNFSKSAGILSVLGALLFLNFFSAVSISPSSGGICSILPFPSIYDYYLWQWK